MSTTLALPPELLSVAELRAVPFSSVKYDDGGDGRRFSGVVRLEPDALVVEGRVSFPETPSWWPRLAEKIGLEMAFRGDFLLTIPYADLDRIELRQGWFLTYERSRVFRQALVLTVKRLSLLRPLPEAERGTLRLAFSRDYRPEAQALASRAALLAQHHRLSL